MKNEKKYKKRLLDFASYIQDFESYPNRFGVIVFHVRNPKDDSQQKVYIQGWLFACLLAFTQTSLNIDEDPVWKKILPIAETCDEFEAFFGISFAELSHLFGSNDCQDIALWGGRRLMVKSDGNDVAINIYEFINRWL